jgi:molecular chaperone DnaK
MLGEFSLGDIAPAPKGVPQIEVTLDIDANGILKVSAKDQSTGKENKITIKANSGLTDAEIQQMVKDGELNAEADKKHVELVNARNSAEGTYNGFKADFDKYSDKVTPEEKTKAEEALNAVQEAMKGDDAKVIQESIPKLYEAIGPITKVKSDEEEAEKKAKEEASKTDSTVVDAEIKESAEAV